MLNTIVVLGLIAVVLWVMWETWNNGWDLRKGAGAVVAALAAWWLWFHDSISSLISGM